MLQLPLGFSGAVRVRRMFPLGLFSVEYVIVCSATHQDIVESRVVYRIQTKKLKRDAFGSIVLRWAVSALDVSLRDKEAIEALKPKLGDMLNAAAENELENDFIGKILRIDVEPIRDRAWWAHYPLCDCKKEPA